MYNSPVSIPYHTPEEQTSVGTVQADVNNHIPKTPEIINALMAITHPLDNIPLTKRDENNVNNNNIPKTPEIINSLMAITNPLDAYVANSSANNNTVLTPTTAVSSTKFTLENIGNNDDKIVLTGKLTESPVQSPTTVQNMCSQLIKEELKVTLQRKKREHVLSSSSSVCSVADYIDLSTMSDCSSSSKYSNGRRFESGDTDEEDQEDESCHSGTDLTEEDAERRRKRRERNKIAATKCRLKKKEKTVNLVQESELLENQNYTLKNQIQELEIQRTRLVDMLSLHKPICTKSLPFAIPRNSVKSEFHTL